MEFGSAGGSDGQFLEGRYQNTGPTAPRLDQDPPDSTPLPHSCQALLGNITMHDALKCSFKVCDSEKTAQQEVCRRGP